MINVRARSSAVIRTVFVWDRSPISSPRSIYSSDRARVHSLVERIVNQFLDVHLHMLASRRRVLQDDEKHVLGAVDHDVGAGRAVPLDLAGRAGRRRHSIAWISADTKAIAKAKTVAGVVEEIAHDARARADMVRCHCRERAGT